MNRHERRGEAKQHAQRARRDGGVAVERTGSLLAAAIGHHDGGRLDEAEALYREVLVLDAAHPEVLHRLGVLAHQRGLHEEGAGLIRQAIALTPDVAAFHANLGWVLQCGGRFGEAEAALRRGLALDPEDAQARNNLGVVLHAQGRLDEAEASFRAALECAPGHADAHSNLGRTLHAQGRFAESVASYRRALALTPDVADIHNNLAVSLKALGRLDEAIAAYRHALALEPAHVTTHVNLGLALQAQDELIEAMACFLRAATLAPDSGEAVMHLGVVLAALGHVDEAVTVHHRAVALRPDDPWTHTNLGLALQEQGHPHEALAAQRRAVAVGLSVVEVHHNLGLALQGVGETDAAVECFELAHVLGLDSPRANVVRGHGLLGQNRFEEGVAAYRRASAGAPDDAKWAIAAAIALPAIPASREAITSARARLDANLDALRRSDLRVVEPDRPGGVGPSFYLTYHGLDDRELQRKMAEVCLRANPSLAWTAPHCVAPSPPAGRRLRVGFVSHYLHAHSVGDLTRGLVEQLSRDRFEVIVFHAGGTVDATSAAIDHSADRAIRLPERLGAARQRIADETLDVLFYPDVGSESITYLLAFARLAPVQCVTWGHPVTTGIPTMDYFLSSAALEPGGSEAYYTERLHRLSRLPAYFYPPAARAGTLTRAALGIEAGARLYVCAQSLFKLHPDYDAILGEILRRDPGGQLVLIEGQSSRWSWDWRARFTRACPDVSARVRFVPRLPTAEFLDLLCMADALLDSLPFGGGTTAYAALGLGAPIVTWPGSFMRGRVTYGCYQQLGVTDCVAASAEEYVALAVRLANDPAWRAELGARLRAGRANLFEDLGVVREIEDFFVRARTEAPGAD